ncbi:hypothetical protein MuYL_0619 [Mucilaginibacter xinganensis]|uniref:Uncharacterized protein n=1 Tax=Mucilaginibacter xinganensis TaxID=1234841 RepID=A0A223NRJ0_9SPHI|nr:hypothetical protein MuYL_0619 [Mucilaginibacter xinganensis]
MNDNWQEVKLKKQLKVGPAYRRSVAMPGEIPTALWKT